MKFNNNMYQLINLLLQNDGITPGSFLASSLGVTTRTIRNYIKNINELSEGIGCEITSVVGRGYILNIKESEKFYETLNSFSTPSNYIEERLKEELLIIIKNTLKISYFTFNQILNELNISDATLNKDLFLIKSSFKENNVRIEKNKNNILIVTGEENSVRGWISQVIYKNSDLLNIENDTYINRIFPNGLINEISKNLNIFIEEVNYQLSDELFNIFVLYVAIGLFRPPVNLKPFKDKRSSQVNNMIKKSLKLIDNIYNSELVIDTWFYTRMILSMNNMFHQNIDNILYFNLESKIVDILQVIQNDTGIQFLLDSILINGLVLHLNSLFERQEFNIRIHNQTLDVIKMHYPLAYEIAILFCKNISNMYDILIDESEIGLIAIHFGGSLERLESHTITPKNVVIVCGHGIAMAMLVKERLKNEFGDQIIVKAVLNSKELLNYDLDNIDYIFTTIPLEIEEQNKVINVDISMSDTNIKSIEKQLYYKSAHESLLSLFSKEHYYKEVLVHSSEEAINWLGNKMVKSGVIDLVNVEEVLKRENISSTEVGNLVAIPHCFNTYNNKSSIGVMILEKPIIWKKEKVQVVFLIVLAADKKPIWENIFRLLYALITNVQKVQKIINDYNFEELIIALSEQ